MLDFPWYNKEKDEQSGTTFATRCAPRESGTTFATRCAPREKGTSLLTKEEYYV